MKSHRKPGSEVSHPRSQNVHGEPPAPPPALIKPASNTVQEPAVGVPTGVPDLSRRVGELEQEVRKARKEALDANARASSLDQRFAEQASLTQRLLAAEADVAVHGRQIAQAAYRAREVYRQEFEKGKRGLLAELETVKTRDSEGRRNDVLAAKMAILLERLDRAAAQSSETVRRIESLERELAEAKARETDAASLRKTADRRIAEIGRHEEARKDQDRRIEELRETVADLKRLLEEAPASSPPSSPNELEPAAADPEEELFPSSKRVPADAEAASEPATEPSSVMDPAAPEPEPAGAPGSSELLAEATKAALEPKNLFGPDGDDGRPSYVLLELLLRDAMGAVYRAYERASDGQFAVRFIPTQESEEKAERVEREVQKLIGLPHPNILQVLGSGRRGNEVYIEMDLVQIEPISQTTIREIPRFCMIFRDLAEAVHYAHEEGVLHGDLTPDTLFLGKEANGDHAYVKDFGLAYLLESLATPAGAKLPALMIRNPAYLPPEQMKDAKGGLSAAADVYGLGAALYSVLTGRAPFEGKDVRQLRSRVMMEEPPPVESLRRDVPMALAVVVRRAMAKEPGLRYSSVRQFAEGLTGFLEGKGTRILSPRPTPAEGL